ncbi:ATP-binding protein [Streptomyces melanogenes]|uniref:ATP-binding protein n=1 Tax=Streptomyces melanogenes TaxID=67326 RepID=A0ABZ1XDK4_9ACTN|nr:ATP-binding protein [Streptomyces melanogenes]
MTESRRFSLQRGPGVVAECRDLTRRVLDEWLGPGGAQGRVAVEDVLLLVSEVATNACRHGDAPYELRLDRVDGKLWVQVSDHSPHGPHPHGRHRPAASSGHGLYLLQNLSSAWGWVPRGAGKTVWFEMPVGRPAGPAR